MISSYKKVNYLLRIRKQIERKIIVETLHRLNHFDNIDISKYHYFGLGSIYYADFQLFHKYLHIEKMTSIDKKAKDEKRFLFNKPYGFIDFNLSDVNDYLPYKLDWGDKLFIWLDFDNGIDRDVVSNINFIASKAKPLDIFIITVNAEHLKNINEDKVFESFKAEFGQYLNPEPPLTKTEYKKNYLKILQKIIKTCVDNGLTSNQGKRTFLQLFNYSYDDGSPMYTYGGIFCDLDGNPSFETLKSRVATLNHVYCDDDIGNIDCPIITPKEKIYIDSHIKDGEFKGEVNNFCICEEDLKKYSKYYKYYPQFFESIY